MKVQEDGSLPVTTRRGKILEVLARAGLAYKQKLRPKHCNSSNVPNKLFLCNPWGGITAGAALDAFSTGVTLSYVMTGEVGAM